MKLVAWFREQYERPEMDEMKKMEPSGEKLVIVAIILFLSPIAIMFAELLAYRRCEADFLALTLTIILVSTVVAVARSERIVSQSHQLSSTEFGRRHHAAFEWLSTLFSKFINHKREPLLQGGHFREDSEQTSRLSAKTNGRSTRLSLDTITEWKYFQPKFIAQELASFWENTRTVVTYGSFYIVGGTIMTAERLARKVKTKYNQNSSNTNLNGYTGSNNSFDSSFMSSTDTADPANDSRNSSKTRKRFTPIKKRMNRFFSSKKLSFGIRDLLRHFAWDRHGPRSAQNG